MFPKIKELDLSHNDFSRKSLTAFGHFIRQNTSLQSLSIDDNWIQYQDEEIDKNISKPLSTNNFFLRQLSHKPHHLTSIETAALPRHN